MNETDIIRGCLRGSAQYQRLLYEQFAGKMYAVCLRYARSPSDAADILQEGFVKVFTKLDQFHFQGSFEGWIRKIMVNTALRAYQKQRFDLESSGLEHFPDASVDPDAIAALSEAEDGVVAEVAACMRAIYHRKQDFLTGSRHICPGTWPP